MDENTVGNGDHHDRRRKTVSGAIPYLKRHGDQDASDHESMRLPWSSPSAPTSPITSAPGDHTASKATAHRRSVSGSIFSRFSFLRAASEDGRSPSPEMDAPSTRSKGSKSPTRNMFSRKSTDDEPQSPLSAHTEGATTSAVKAGKTRKRKGSLRKTALLGTRRIVPETKERKGSFSLLQRPQIKQPPAEEMVDVSSDGTDVSGESPDGWNQPAPETPVVRRPISYERIESSHGGSGSWSESPAVAVARLALVTNQEAQLDRVLAERAANNQLSSPLDAKSPTSQASYTSTTDEDELLTFGRPAPTFPSQGSIVSSLDKPLSSTAASYFPPESESSLSLRQRRTSKRSPLSHSVPIPDLSEPEAHDYTETEYWGWVILFVTWLTFAVGMGSCLEIWSWAWDVGQTPYAPPELENDESLPIVGYYPALIVLTGVVAWVWITVAWVGMKYFRHAKIEV